MRLVFEAAKERSKREALFVAKERTFVDKGKDKVKKDLSLNSEETNK